LERLSEGVSEGLSEGLTKGLLEGLSVVGKEKDGGDVQAVNVSWTVGVPPRLSFAVITRFATAPSLGVQLMVATAVCMSLLVTTVMPASAITAKVAREQRRIARADPTSTGLPTTAVGLDMVSNEWVHATKEVMAGDCIKGDWE
jgi:hypothetical protein